MALDVLTNRQRTAFSHLSAECLYGLSGDGGDQIEVAVVVQYTKRSELRERGDQQV